MKRGKENLKKDNSNLHRCIHTRMDENSNRVKKTGKMYIQNIHYTPFVEHLYIQSWATSPSCPTQTKGNKMFWLKTIERMKNIQNVHLQSINELNEWCLNLDRRVETLEKLVKGSKKCK